MTKGGFDKKALFDIASKRESKQGLEQLERTRFFADDLVGGKQAEFCIPASIKARLLTTLRSDLKAKAAAFGRSKDEGTKATNVQSIVKRVATAGRILKDIPNCDGEALDGEMGRVLDVMNQDTLIEAIKGMEGVENEVKAVRKEQTAIRLKEEGKEPDLPSRDEFIKKLYDKLGKQLLFAAYDGIALQKEANILSPCGIPMVIGSGKDSVQKSLDRLAFLGSKLDWIAYYVDGQTDHIDENGTFEPLAGGDWAGCVKELYEDVSALKQVTVDKISKRRNASMDYSQMPMGGYNSK